MALFGDGIELKTQKFRQQQANIRFTFGQAGQPYLKTRQALQQGVSKILGFHFAFQIRIGGGNQAHVDF